LTVKNSIEKRSTESDDKINMRIAKASVELATAPQFDVVIKTTIWIPLWKSYELVKDFVNK
jgi:guanylate kinase